MAGEVVYKIADLSRVWLEGEVFERDLPAVRLGLPVTAEFIALPGVIREGRVTYVYPTVNPDTRTARIRVELPNPEAALKPGMYATIRFSGRTDSVLSVPRSAVLATGERNLVFVRSGAERFVPHVVTLGAATDDRVAILDGLSLSDTVVASGTFLMDAESNLGSLMGGMGNMPGMDVAAPARDAAPGELAPEPRPAPRSGRGEE
jgi:Cu(I)/Ag(I) efflux system membrane fusion protein